MHRATRLYLVLAIAATSVVADDVELANGKLFRDVDVRLDDASALVDLGFGTLRLPRAQIARIVDTGTGAADWRPRSPVRQQPPAVPIEPVAIEPTDPWRRMADILVEALERRDAQLDATLAIIEERADAPAPVPAFGLPIYGFYSAAPLPAPPGGTTTWEQLSRHQPGSFISPR